MKPKRYEQTLIKPRASLKEAIKHMDRAAMQVLMVVDDKKHLLGIVTDGDIRRAILKEIDFKTPIGSIMSKKPVFLNEKTSKKRALALMKTHSIRHIPALNKDRQVVGLFLWEDYLNNGDVRYPPKKVPVVIVAGGKGVRLDPFTKILPKPLIPIGENPIIEIIMNNFKKYGFRKFILTLNYRAEMIKLYFSGNSSSQVEFVEEKEYLGTAGSLSLARKKLKGTFIVSNSDIIIDANFDTLLNFHVRNKNHVTVLGIIRHVLIPYGVLKIRDANLDDIDEKPEYQLIINSGIYVLEPEIITLIKKREPLGMPDLILTAKKRGFKVQAYPLSCPWFDVGEWKEYQKALEYIQGSGREQSEKGESWRFIKGK